MRIDDLRELIACELDRLDRIGSADAIAQELSSRGVQGMRWRNCDCPLARHLDDVTLSEHGMLAVNIRNGVLAVDYAASRVKICARATETPCGKFVHRFDGGNYPYLESEEDNFDVYPLGRE